MRLVYANKKEKLLISEFPVLCYFARKINNIRDDLSTHVVVTFIAFFSPLRCNLVMQFLVRFDLFRVLDFVKSSHFLRNTNATAIAKRSNINTLKKQLLSHFEDFHFVIINFTQLKQCLCETDS